MVRYYTLSGNDNDSFMCSNADKIYEQSPDLGICSSCGYRTNFEYINQSFFLKRRIYDISYTYDGYCIVSLKFKEICDRFNFKGLRFVSIKSEPHFFCLFVDNIVGFDALKRETKFENKCNLCGNYQSVVGAHPAFIKEPLSANICRTDIIFGSGNEKSLILLITDDTKIILQQNKLAGLQLGSVNYD